MATIKTNFSYQTGNVITTELGPLPTVTPSYDTSIPVANTLVVTDISPANGIMYMYTLPVDFFYTDPTTNVASKVITASIGIKPTSNIEQIVISTFPQYFDL